MLRARQLLDRLGTQRLPSLRQALLAHITKATRSADQPSRTPAVLSGRTAPSGASCAGSWATFPTAPVVEPEASSLVGVSADDPESATLSEVQCRPAEFGDFTFLATMLGEAAVWRPDKHTPTADEVMADPRYAMYLEAWPRQGDYGLIAEHDGPVGAAWYRTYTEASHGHGFVAEDVPELSIAVIAPCRRRGIGRRLLVELIEASVAQGYRALSLSVAVANPARALYESAGFVLTGRHGTTYTMLRHAARRT